MTTFSPLGFARVFLRLAVAAKENLAAPRTFNQNYILQTSDASKQ